MRPTRQSDADIYAPMMRPARHRSIGRSLRTRAVLDLKSHPFHKPTAILFRQIATPSFEMAFFLRKAERLGLEPVIIEHRLDRFCVHNASKRALVTLPIRIGRNRHGHAIVRHQKLIEHNAAEGQPFEGLITRSGESLITYHHRKLQQVMGAHAPPIVDLSDLIDSAADGPRAYYVNLFMLMTRQVFLFEDFVVDGQTDAFFNRVVRPAYASAMQALGQRPQVVKLMLGHLASAPWWNHYPPAMVDEESWLAPASKRVDRAA